MKILLLMLTISILACSTTVEPYATYPADLPPTETAIPAAGEEPAGEVYWPASPQVTISSKCATVTADTALHLRAAPSEQSQVKDYLFHGDQLELLEMRAKWWKVKSSDQIGWAKADFLKESECK